MGLRPRRALGAAGWFAVVATLALAAAAPTAALAATRAGDAWRATEFRAGITPGCSITDITRGPDGNFWFAEYANQAIGRITPQGKVLEIPLPYDEALGPFGFPPAITAGPDGNLWFLRRNGQVGRITPAGVVTEFSDGITGFTSPVTATALPNRIVAGPDGNLWFTEPDGVIGRVTTTGAVTEFRDGITQYFLGELGSLAGIAAGPDGNLWFTQVNGAIGRITPQGEVTEFTAGLSGKAVPVDITRGPDGNLWFTELYGNRIGRITPQGTITEFSAGISPHSAPSGITIGPDGNLWFGERAGRLGRITPQGVVKEFAAGRGANPTAVTRGQDGGIWYATSDRVGRLGLPPRVTGVTLRGRSLALTVSAAVVVTARVGTHRFRVRLTAGRRTVRLPLWLVAARARGVRLVATDPFGATAGVTLPRRPA